MSGLRTIRDCKKHSFRLRQITTLVITSHQLCEKPIFPRAPPNDVFEQRLGLIGPIFPKIGARDIVFRFDLGRLRHLLLVGAWIFDVTEGGELLHQFVSLFTIYPLARYVHPAFTGNFFPARDRLHARRDLERFEQRPAVHVFADRNVEQRQDGRRDIDQARAVDAFVALDARVPPSQIFHTAGARPPGRRVLAACRAGAASRIQSRGRSKGSRSSPDRPARASVPASCRESGRRPSRHLCRARNPRL